MPTSTFYPPHPAEGHTTDRFANYRAGHGWQAEAIQSLPPGELSAEPHKATALPDRRSHWLAYDPSSRSQYPVD